MLLMNKLISVLPIAIVSIVIAGTACFQVIQANNCDRNCKMANIAIDYQQLGELRSRAVGVARNNSDSAAEEQANLSFREGVSSLADKLCYQGVDTHLAYAFFAANREAVQKPETFPPYKQNTLCSFRLKSHG
jgi:hypothetical protein